MRVTYSESLTTIEATAEEIRSSQSLKETFTRVLSNILGGIAPAEEDQEEDLEAEEHDGCVGCCYEFCSADDEIRVGDEVIAALTNERGHAIVTKVNNEKEARYIYADGTTGWDALSELKKTGRHFSEVEKLLEAMRK